MVQYNVNPWNPWMPITNQGQVIQPPVAYQQPTNQVIKVDGPDEAMSRILMTYPASQLVPGFVSHPVFDVNGRQFHVLSIEQDGRRNLETFDFTKHIEEEPVTINGAEFASKRELDELAAKVAAMTEVVNGVHGSILQQQQQQPAGTPVEPSV